jgi:regulator of protease activity HflC (stomatin/prohibitin superfamily)
MIAYAVIALVVVAWVGSALSVRVIKQCERAVLLQLGKVS